MRTLLSDALIVFLRLVMRVFFRSIEVSGLDNVPAREPVIFIGNHPNSLLDPVMVTTTCGRRVRFAAKEVLFRGPLRPFLWLLGSVPIRRRQDQVAGAPEDGPVEGAPARVDNAAAFDALLAVLSEGGAFGIFPEGISHTRPELAPLKSGAARVALLAAARGIPVKIVPVGLHYRRRDRMRTRALVQYGQPLVVEDRWLEAMRADQPEAARALTAEFAHALRDQTITAPDFDTLRVLEGCRRLYRPDGLGLSLTQQAALMRRFLEHWERLRHEPAVSRLYRDVAAYQLSLRALELQDKDLRGQPTSRRMRLLHILRHLWASLVLVPLAVPGVLIHLPVLAASVTAGHALTERGDVRATIKVCVATSLTLMAYVTCGLAVFARTGGLDGVVIAACTLVILALSGHATIRVLERQGELRRGLSVLVALLHLDREIARLAEERERLRLELLRLVDLHFGLEQPRIVERSRQRADAEARVGSGSAAQSDALT